MTSSRPAPPLPQPPHPAAAARAVTVAAQAAACAWAQPLDPAAHSRAVSQLHSTLRDLGIAARGLAAYQPNQSTPGAASRGFQDHTAAASRWLLGAWQCLDSVLAAEGVPPSGNPGEPGAALCQAARDAILAWRQPAGTVADRDDTVRRLVAATGFISAALPGLAAFAPRQLAISLQTAGNHVAEATACLAAAVQPPEEPAPAGKDGLT